MTLLTGCLLCACASDRAMQEGRRLLAEGKVEEALAELDRASREHQGDRELRAYYLRQREAAVARILVEADSARINEQFDLAEIQYRRILRLDKGSVRAQAGLDAVTAGRRHMLQLAEAEIAFGKGNMEEAEARLARILRENPQHPGARALKREIAEKSAALRTVPLALNISMGKPISLDFRDANLKSVFEVISRSTGINFLFDRDVRSDLKTTIFVRNTPIEDAVKLVLSTNQLAYKALNENSLLVYPNVPVKAREYQDLVIKGFYLTNADAKQTMNLIKSVIKTRDVFIDEKLGLLVMQDTPDAVRLAERLVAMQDLAEPEVMLEVEVLEVSHKRLLDIGITPPTQLDLTAVGTAIIPETTAVTASGTTSFTGLPVNVPLTLDKLRHINGQGLQVSNPITASIRFNMENGDTNILANPRIRVKNREKAKIHIGERVPVITSTVTSAGNTSFLPETVNYLDVGIKLEVEPTVHLTDEVGMKVTLEVSSLGQKTVTKNGSEVYRVGTRNTSTALRLRDGETQVLAGLINDEERQAVIGLPGLGNIPALGRLFSSKNDSKDKTEIVLLITPRVVRGLSRPDASITEFVSGPEAAVGSGPMTLRSGGSMQMSPFGSGGNSQAPAQAAPVEDNDNQPDNEEESEAPPPPPARPGQPQAAMPPGRGR